LAIDDTNHVMTEDLYLTDGTRLANGYIFSVMIEKIIKVNFY